MSSAAENLPIAGGKAATYIGAVSAIVSGWTISEIGIVVGTLVGVLGLIFSQYWAWRKETRESLEQELRVLKEYGAQWEQKLYEYRDLNKKSKG